MSEISQALGELLPGGAVSAIAELQSNHRAYVEDAMQLARGRAVQMHHMLTAMCAQQDCTFTFRGNPLPTGQVMAPEMFLPMVAGTAQDDGRQLLDVDLGCALRLDDESLFGMRAVVPHLTGHIVDVVRGLFFLHAAQKVFGLRPRANIDLTATYEIMNEQFRGLRQALGSPESEIPWPHPQPLN